MKRLRTVAVLLALVAASAGWSHARDACVKITGSSQGAYPTETSSGVCLNELGPEVSFRASSIHHLLRSEDGRQLGHEALVMTKVANASTTKLWRSLKNGESLSVEIVIVGFDFGTGVEEGILKLTLEDALVIGIEPISERNDVASPSPDREKVQFRYQRLTIERPSGEVVQLDNR